MKLLVLVAALLLLREVLRRLSTEERIVPLEDDDWTSDTYTAALARRARCS